MKLASMMFGDNLKEFQFSLLPKILSHDPAGVSLKTIVHYHQMVHSGRFARFDYGSRLNREIYHSPYSTDYEISKIQVPVGIFWAQNDIIGDPQVEFIKEKGYPAESHVVLTEDGYYLLLHRIPGKSGSTPVFLQHGMFSSSFDWVVTGKGRGLAFVLSDQGYDVWLGNSRGNMYSSCHTRYTPEDPEFWDFSWHEMGVYDLPASVKYITNRTNKNLIYVGHSMGTIASYVMAIENPDVASKVNAIYSFSPVAFVSKAASILFSSAKIFNLQALNKILPLGYILSHIPKWKYFIEAYCNANLNQTATCLRFSAMVFGSNLEDFEFSRFPQILTHDPSGVSLKTLLHYHQMVHSGRFAHYDYGRELNEKIYETGNSPDYDISKIQRPVGLFWAENDPVGDYEEILQFYNKLPNKIFINKVKDNRFNHVDYLWGKKIYELVYSKLLASMEKYK
ncbi:hypothetical protein QAD02_004462 [Eretmocerus hayati]|uniref:Uncharacterized protein n=1 Tax=Eretmocerus hayati TaxID=131215 RepID=A0ACC2NUG3_9HYME|nr:hypothetical protein QAD02_004462 [Eretmocerus hayati]